LPTIAHSLNLEEEKKYDFLRYRTIVFIANAWVINLAGKRISVLRWAGVCVSGEKYMSTAAPCRVTSFSALCAAPNVCIVSKFLSVLILCATTTYYNYNTMYTALHVLIKCIILCGLTPGCMHFGLKFSRRRNKFTRSPLSRTCDLFQKSIVICECSRVK
jgi:hypothetical protein